MKITVKQADITGEQVDAIVNAANEGLAGGGGVDGAIHRVGGEEIREECRRLRQERGPRPCPTGEAVATSAGNLPCRWVIHTVGPIWRGGREGEPELLRSCYLNSLKVAEELGARSLAFPCISAGVFGYPGDKAAGVAVETVRGFPATTLEEVRFVVFGPRDLAVYQELLETA